MVSSTGTLVNSDYTSIEAMMLEGREPLIRSKNSFEALRLFEEEVNGESSSFSRFAKAYVTGIWLMIARRGKFLL